MSGLRDRTRLDFYGGKRTGSVAAIATDSHVVVSEEPWRIYASIFNDSPEVMFLQWDHSASSADFFLRMDAYTLYETPRPAPTGSLYARWPVATGSARFLEVGNDG